MFLSHFLREVAADHTGPHLLFTSMGDGQNPAWGCYSFVGYQGVAGQLVNLGSPACLVRGRILHETLHALGQFLAFFSRF